MTMTGRETEWGGLGVSKRVRVTALFFPSLVQCSLLRRYHHLEHLIRPCSRTLLSGAKRHPRINGQQARVSSKLYRCSFYSYPISYLRIVNKIKWAVLMFQLVCWPVPCTIGSGLCNMRLWRGCHNKCTGQKVTWTSMFNLIRLTWFLKIHNEGFKIWPFYNILLRLR